MPDQLIGKLLFKFDPNHSIHLSKPLASN